MAAEVWIFLLMISIFVPFSQSWFHLQTINFLEELISPVLGVKFLWCCWSDYEHWWSPDFPEALWPFPPLWLFLHWWKQTDDPDLRFQLWGGWKGVGWWWSLDQLWPQISSASWTLTESSEEPPVSQTLKETELLGEESFPLKSKSAQIICWLWF